MTTPDQINILVTAVGGELAISILKALKLCVTPITITGCDIFKDAAGKKWCNSFYQVSPVRNSEQYLRDLEQIITGRNIDVIIPASDFEFTFFALKKTDILKKFRCQVLVQNREEWSRFDDKWLAYNWFLQNKIPTPQTFLPTEFEKSKLVFPLIIKPRRGGGSRHIHLVNNWSEFDNAIKNVPNPIIQEVILPNEHEYTAGTFRSKSDDIHVIVMQRELKFGMTNKAKVVQDKGLEKFCIDTIRGTNLTGSNNIQFRINQTGPKVLEINHRFSGTTGIRAYFGFNDAEMWVRDVMDLPQIQNQIRNGSVVRFLEEIYEFE